MFKGGDAVMVRGRQKRLTLKDIADKTGYSVITVSKALRDTADLAVGTKELIRRVASEMGYVANGAANALRSGKTNTIAMTLVDVSNPYWGCFAKRVNEIALLRGYTVMMMNTDMDGKSEEAAIRTAVERGVDGFLIDPSVSFRKNVRILEKLGIPFVVASYLPEDEPYDAVFFDEYQSAYLPARRFAQTGRDSVIMLNLPEGLPSAEARRRGFLDGLAAEGLGPENVAFANVPNGENECLRVLNELLRERPDANAVLTYSDHRALEVADALLEMGRRIPEDIALIGCGDIESHMRVPFSLTTVHAVPTQTAHEAAELLFRRLEGTGPEEKTHLSIPTRLVLRKSG